MSIDKKFDGMNVSNSRKKLEWKYSGDEDMYLEGRVGTVEDDKLKISLCGPWPKDIVSSNYVEETKTFQIYVKHPPNGVARIAVLKLVDFYVPKETKKVHVYGERKCTLPSKEAEAKTQGKTGTGLEGKVSLMLGVKEGTDAKTVRKEVEKLGYVLDKDYQVPMILEEGRNDVLYLVYCSKKDVNKADKKLRKFDWVCGVWSNPQQDYFGGQDWRCC